MVELAGIILATLDEMSYPVEDGVARKGGIKSGIRFEVDIRAALIWKDKLTVRLSGKGRHPRLRQRPKQPRLHNDGPALL